MAYLYLIANLHCEFDASNAIYKKCIYIIIKVKKRKTDCLLLLKVGLYTGAIANIIAYDIYPKLCNYDKIIIEKAKKSKKIICSLKMISGYY